MDNFFDVIGVADLEKVHSSVIGWMLSDKCNAFGLNGLSIRSSLLQNIFNVKPERLFRSITAYIEWNDIDILLVSEDDEGQQCWVIENKIKSSQHSSQLDKYYDIIAKAFPTADSHFCLLTLIEEEPVCKKGEWFNRQYNDLCSFLNGKLTDCPSKDNKDYVILREYVACISKLSETVNEFITHHTCYNNVFTDGVLKKEEKTHDLCNENALYISENGLETIFQKCFLHKIILECGKDFMKPFSSFAIKETHGTALVDLTRYQSREFNEYGFQQIDIGIQFQNGSFKIQILGRNNDNKVKTDTSSFLNHWSTIAANLWGSEWRINRSKGDKKPYLSFTRKDSWWNGLEPWYNNRIEDIVKVWKNACNTCKDMIGELIK